MSVFQAFRAYVCVDLCGGDVSVAQKFLDNPKIGSALKQVCCKRMAKKVRIDVGIDACEFRPLFDDLANPFGRQWAAPDTQENV